MTLVLSNMSWRGTPPRKARPLAIPSSMDSSFSWGKTFTKDTPLAIRRKAKNRHTSSTSPMPNRARPKSTSAMDPSGNSRGTKAWRARSCFRDATYRLTVISETSAP